MRTVKRACDVVMSLGGLVCLSPLFAVVAVLIKLDSEGPVFFLQERIGRHFVPFQIYKFRTMVADAPRMGGPLTTGRDKRVTRLGRLLRLLKFDELPQLINVLKGEMSVVGPRPEVGLYVELFRQDYAEILTVRPGLTDPASIAFRDEAILLDSAADPEAEYVSRVLPAKLSLSKEYIRRSSLALDVLVIVRTIAALTPWRGLR